LELVNSGKPEAMINQILEWKIRKTLADQVLLEQEYIRDWSKKVKEILPQDFKVINFIRISVF
jgi:translation elongation factor EF-Ts